MQSTAEDGSRERASKQGRGEKQKTKASKQARREEQVGRAHCSDHGDGLEMAGHVCMPKMDAMHLIGAEGISFCLIEQTNQLP